MGFRPSGAVVPDFVSLDSIMPLVDGGIRLANTDGGSIAAVAGRAYFMQFWIPKARTLAAYSVVTGVGSANTHFGVYDRNLQRLATTGAVAVAAVLDTAPLVASIPAGINYFAILDIAGGNTYFRSFNAARLLPGLGFFLNGQASLPVDASAAAAILAIGAPSGFDLHFS